MYEFSVLMGLVDFVPVLFFGVSAFLLQQDLFNKMGRNAFALFAAGTLNIFAAGFLKALWKTLYAAGICDFEALATMFLPVQSLGFLLAGMGIVLMLCVKRRNAAVLAAPPVFSGSMVFIMMMVLGLGSICTVLSILAVKMKKKGAVILFVLAFLCSMGMGAMAGQDSTKAIVNWIEQGINIVSQGCLAAGVMTLHRSGLKELKL